MTERRFQYQLISQRRSQTDGWEDRGLVHIVDHSRHEEGQRRLIRKLLPPGVTPQPLSIYGTILTH
jgi:hypothetical protein